MGFSNETLDFLAENHIINSRAWFQEHKPRYRALVEAPMLALSAALAPTMAAIDPSMTLVPKRTLSRIWKDMRYNRDGTLFRDVMWLLFRRGKGMEYPAFFFEFSPRGYRYGVSCHSGPGSVMDCIRQWVRSDDPRYRKAQAALDALPDFALEGERYKRSRYPGETETKREWLERKHLLLIHRSRDMDGLFHPDLPQELARAFQALAPVYQLFLEAHLQSLPPTAGKEQQP